MSNPYGNKYLNKANRQKQDEFYTKITDIEKELRHYTRHFKDAVIFCNCDDPDYSNFWRYFQLNFYEFGIKKLISTHYETDKPSYKLEIVATEKEKQVGIPDYVKTPLKQNGDFRSPECIEIMKEADIVITNPPFSLFREYLAELIKYEKQFVIIANQNTVKYKEVFPLFMENKIWLGYHIGDMEFSVPDYYEPRETRYREENGIKYRSLGNICWITNLDIPKRHENITLYKTYSADEYPKYDNYDAIEVSRTSEIPIDYDGVMGVPITFLGLYNPEQFELLGMTDRQNTSGLRTKKYSIEDGIDNFNDLNASCVLLKDGKYKSLYTRFLIRRKR